MSVIFPIIYFVIVLGILVFIHEFGHFLMARLSGMRVDVFALGMGYRILGWNKVNGFSFGKLPEDIELNGYCDYRLAVFPIGGYCKIAGMIDETFDSNFAEQPPEQWEFRAKNPFKKGITIIGGVLFNMLLAVILFAAVLYHNGENAYRTTTIGSVPENTIGSYIGLKSGDEVISINKKTPQHWTQMLEELTVTNLGKDLNVIVRRDGKDTNLFVDGNENSSRIGANTPLGIEPADMHTLVLEVMSDGVAAQNGFKANDTIISVNGQPIYSSGDLITKLKNHKNQAVSIVLHNSSGEETKHLQLSETGTIGVQISSVFAGEIETIHYNLFESIGKGATQSLETFATIVTSIKQIFIGNIAVKQAIGGPVMIAKQASNFAQFGFYSFISFIAMLSVSLAFINILPFPALDGGHLIIIIIEAFARREIPVKVKLGIQQAGMVVLLALMAYVIFNDIQKII
ncbi:MAG: RIP metalloprotease RseP [Ignavibacteria bacterium]|nr:RIP metalloprotease RseP [Ignavibacteria bacterium]